MVNQITTISNCGDQKSMPECLNLEANGLQQEKTTSCSTYFPASNKNLRLQWAEAFLYVGFN